MENIQYFNAFVRNPVDNQVCVENDVAVSAAFGCKMAAFGICQIEIVKRIQRLSYFLPVTFCLKVSECFK